MLLFLFDWLLFDTSCSDVELFSSMIIICESISLAVSATLRPRFVDPLMLSFAAAADVVVVVIVVVPVVPVVPVVVFVAVFDVVVVVTDGGTEVADAFVTLE